MWADRGAPGFGLAGLVLVALTSAYWAAGVLLPTELPHYATSARQITGMALLLISVPTYMLLAWAVGRRRSLDLVEQLRPLAPDPADVDAAVDRICSGLGAKGWALGTVLGLSFGLLNTEPLKAFSRSAVPEVDVSISMGQLFMWWVVALLLMDRARSARAFRDLGRVIRFDLFRLDTIRPLARAGIIDVVIVAGALLLSPLQSLDAEFRPENYRFALVVATPAMLFFVIWPLRPIHQRIQAERASRLAAIEEQLARLGETRPDASAGSVGANTTDLELLLAHRDRLVNARTWPLDLRLLSRIVIYLIIPPLAWAGAALVERLIDAALSG